MSPLPIVGQDVGGGKGARPTKIASSPMGRRRAWVLGAVHLVVIGHLLHWRLAGSTLSPVEPSEAMEFSKFGVINAGAIFFAVAILSTLLFGRFFCGWGCHILALQDLCGALLEKMGIRPRPLRSRVLVWVPLLAFIYMFLWPVAYRIWIGDSLAPRAVELYTEDFWATFPAWPVALLTFLFCGFVIVYFLGQKGFCTYACPYGGIFGLADRFSPLRIRVDDSCSSCGHCTAVCTSNVRVHEEVRDYGAVVDPGCMKCMDCVAVCPNQALGLRWGSPAVGAEPRRQPEPTKFTVTPREEVLLAVAFLFALWTVRGLYGIFPFLLSLGMAAILAFLTLTSARLAYRKHLRLRTWQLKKDGGLTSEGRLFLTVAAVLGLLWLHGATIQGLDFLGDRAFREVGDLRARVLSLEDWRLSAEETAALEKTVRYQGASASLSLVSRPDLELRSAWMSLLLDRDDDFEHWVRRAERHGVDESVLLTLVARRHARHERWDQAARAYERAVAADPDALQPHLGLGMLLAGLGDVEGAQAVFRRGIARLPEAADLYYNSAVALVISGDVSGAVQRFEEALALDPTHLAARENLAGVLVGIGRYREGLEHYSIALRQSPSDIETRLSAARVHLELAEQKEALEQVRKALEIDPDHLQAGEMARRLGQP